MFGNPFIWCKDWCDFSTNSFVSYFKTMACCRSNSFELAVISEGYMGVYT